MKPTIFALPLSMVWMLLTGLNRMLFALGLRQPERLPVRVISVGNFEAGGTGKTPVVAEVAREALERGEVPVILTRGYGGSWEKVGGLISPRSIRESEPRPTDCGDEAALLHLLVPEAWIGVGARRGDSWRRVSEFVKTTGSDRPTLVVLDDGLQHLQLVRDVELILQTSRRPWQSFFREWPGGSRAALRIWTKGEKPPIGWQDGGQAIRCSWRIEERAATSSQGARPLFLVTGVADGGAVRRSLEAAGWKVLQHIERRDHSRYQSEEIRQWQTEARTAGCVLATTGKDFVKWTASGEDCRGVLVFEPRIQWSESGRAKWSSRLWRAPD